MEILFIPQPVFISKGRWTLRNISYYVSLLLILVLSKNLAWQFWFHYKDSFKKFVLNNEAFVWSLIAPRMFAKMKVRIVEISINLTKWKLVVFGIVWQPETGPDPGTDTGVNLMAELSIMRKTLNEVSTKTACQGRLCDKYINFNGLTLRLPVLFSQLFIIGEF